MISSLNAALVHILLLLISGLFMTTRSTLRSLWPGALLRNTRKQAECMPHHSRVSGCQEGGRGIQ